MTSSHLVTFQRPLHLGGLGFDLCTGGHAAMQAAAASQGLIPACAAPPVRCGLWTEQREQLGRLVLFSGYLRAERPGQQGLGSH